METRKRLIIPKPLVIARIQRLTLNAKIPSWTRNGIGFNIYSSKDYIFKPGDRIFCKTDLALTCTQGFYFRIISPFLNNIKPPFAVEERTVDPRTRGELYVTIINYSKQKDVSIKKGDLVAQLIISKAEFPTLMVE